LLLSGAAGKGHGGIATAAKIEIVFNVLALSLVSAIARMVGLIPGTANGMLPVVEESRDYVFAEGLFNEGRGHRTMTWTASQRLALLSILFAAIVSLPLHAQNASTADAEAATIGGWQMQDAAKVAAKGSAVSSKTFHAEGWYRATVPGTVLTTLVDNHVYPEPTYGENNRPEVISDSLARTSFWYRATLQVPRSYRRRHVWLNFDGINYSATIWVNGTQVGTMRGAFQRGAFDVTAVVKPGTPGVVAVLIAPQPHPGVPHEHTLRAGIGMNGGITALDGPTFLSTIGWDWLPAIRDRDSGMWRKVYLSASGPVLVKDPYVTTDLAVPSYASAAVTVKSMVENITDQPQKGVLKGAIGDIAFQQEIELGPHARQEVVFDPATIDALRIQHPKLWWPNGYGPQNLYKLHLSFDIGSTPSSAKDVSFGVRKITYSVATTESLAIVVNGVPVFIRGGNWGLDEALKRIPVERLDAQIRMHRLANLNMIRNWVGQSTSEEFYELCDKYGLLVWDEFFQPNPGDGPDPEDIATYLANVRDKVLRFRNHPSIVLWCARNEGNPPKDIDAALRVLLKELDPVRLYQANSSDGRGVRSHGPYRWRAPREFYVLSEGFKSETGTMSIPTIESIQGMMPQKDWETITDDWAEHDFAPGNSGAEVYKDIIEKRYGKVENLADFVRKSQLANYESFRAMYEGRNAELFHPTTGIMTWMSHPAQPSFVWQLYHYDLEPNASFFAVKSASEMVHVQFNEIRATAQVINNLSEAFRNGTVHAEVINLDGKISSQQDFAVNAPASSAMDVGQVEFHEPLTGVHFLKLQLRDASGRPVSESFYWHTNPEQEDDFTSLASMAPVELTAKVARIDRDGRSTITVTLHNPTQQVALMTHLQLHRQRSGERVLPAFYSDNYVSLTGGEDKVVTIEADTKLLNGEPALVLVDGWNASVVAAEGQNASLATNVNARVDHWPHTGLPFQTEGLR